MKERRKTDGRSARMNKEFTREELISSNELKRLDHDQLFDELLATYEKLGLVHNNELKAVILPIQSYELLLGRLEKLEDLYEDLVLSNDLDDRLHLAVEEWIEKPAQVSRIQFLEHWLEETGSEP
jgi:hypothetical protein